MTIGLFIWCHGKLPATAAVVMTMVMTMTAVSMVMVVVVMVLWYLLGDDWLVVVR